VRSLRSTSGRSTEQERHRAHSTLFDVDNKATVWVFVLDRIGCFTIYVGIRTWVVNGLMAVLFIYSANVIKICSQMYYPCGLKRNRLVLYVFLSISVQM
jgi:hypothetical protein